ncbi:MAG TPA: acyl-CoA thioesterase [Candidatus Binatia bacterium]|jgi:acyl-CoA thioester hydrolase|nr:acyl-CoA thioesterase [Candidatus Binatia bacterium]
MAHKFACRFRVRHDELDSFGHLNNAVCVKYMQEAAIQASADAGYPLHWYEEHRVGWVIRRLEIRYHRQVLYGDELEVTTWISECGRIDCLREYDVTRARDGAHTARGRVRWIHVDSKAGRPLRLPEEFKIAFSPTGQAEDLGIRAYKSRKIDGCYRYRSTRRVQAYELDPLGRVHHAVYLNWIEQAYYDAIRSAGRPLEQLRSGDWMVFQGGHDIEYFSPTRDNDEIEIISWVCEIGKVRGAWIHEVYDARNKKLLARDYSLGVFVNSQGKPTSAPQDIIEGILQGPRT